MSIDVTIRNKLFSNKTMPLDVILGDSLIYGKFVDDHLIPGELGEGEFIAYCPEAIGRGFSVVWNPREKKRINLRLPQPSTPHELKLFYSTVERICNYWQGKLIVDGNALSLTTFLNGLDDMLCFNSRWLQQLSRQILDGESDSWTLYSAKYPVDMGREEAEWFLSDEEYFAQWLHEKQSVDACFSSPVFYSTDSGITGVYFISAGTPYLLPESPAVPFGMMNPATGKPLECGVWRAVIVSEDAQEPEADMDYAEFVNRIPQEMREKFDGKRFITRAFTKQELQVLAENA